MNRFYLSALVILTGFGFLIFYHSGFVPNFVSAQSQCCNPPTFPPAAGKFPAGATVTVTISQRFTATERQNIITAFQNWNTANASNGSGVVFALPPLTGETPVESNNNQFVGYNPNLTTAGINILNNDSNGFHAVMWLGGSIRTGGTPAGREAYTRGLTRHEIGHALGLANRENCSPANCSIMCTPATADHNITSCDNGVVGTVYPTPTPTPPPPSCDPQPCWDIIGCVDCHPEYCYCTYVVPSPVIIDVSVNGFQLTNNANGVNFDLDTDGTPERLSWTAPGVDDAFLVLDRNGNGSINNGEELFGNYTPQPTPTWTYRNGFNALAGYDKPQNGGNGDGRISPQDSIFTQLKLWTDANHNGVSEPNELRFLSSSPVRSIDLDYRESRRTDEHGNQFKYRARVRDGQGNHVGRWAWDVFLIGEDSSNSNASLIRREAVFQVAKPSCKL